MPMHDHDWQQKLTPEEYRICRQKGTEPAFSGIYWDTKDAGVYRCKCCDALLFTSDEKFDSGCGWPSFYATALAGKLSDNVAEQPDHSHGMVRTEITCKQCGSHLGHVFPDGPAPTGLRYCVNSASIHLDAADDS